MWLLSTLVGELLLFMLAWTLTVILGIGLCWATGLLRWQRSTLPEPCSPEDSAWDGMVMGWWFDAPKQDDSDWGERLVRRTFEGRSQVLLTIEQIDQPDPRVWVVLYNARL